MIQQFPNPTILDESFRETFDIPEKTMTEMLEEVWTSRPQEQAISFLGARITYGELNERIDACIRGLAAIGFKKGDVFSFCMPNIPETVVLFYAVNRIGGICNMIHPLAPPAVVIDSVTSTKSRFLAFPELFLPRLASSLEEKRCTTRLELMIVVPMAGSGDLVSRIGLWLAKGRKVTKMMPRNKHWILWKDMIKKGTTRHSVLPSEHGDPHRVSVYLHSGGTTADPKIIELSDHNFNVIAYQIIWAVGEQPGCSTVKGHSMVTILPLFHGFGLCIGMHSMLVNGQCCILVPQFSPDGLASVIKKHRPTLMAGVPTLFEGILNSPAMKDVDFSCFRAIFCGGDTLPPELKTRFDRFLKEHGSTCKLREGYGLTETVTVCSLSHEKTSDRNGIGFPLACMKMKIIDPVTRVTLSDGETGEICVTGPTVMRGYLNDPKATANAIRKHDDGQFWVETGDLGWRDPDGFYHFTSRIKRMIKVSGIPVYPSQVEMLIAELPEVLQVAAIGIPHPYKMQVVKAFVSVREGTDKQLLERKIKETIRQQLLRYAVPDEIEFIDEFPKTAVGKIDTRKLEAMEQEKREQNG
ncbi:MAG TPA: long-chain fatty acid--CoA ligase [Clostridiaceae bacterium]|nr:long-chain fatty acid--CoA ligase [Clostridiaceae bacterium]